MVKGSLSILDTSAFLQTERLSPNTVNTADIWEHMKNILLDTTGSWEWSMRMGGEGMHLFFVEGIRELWREVAYILRKSFSEVLLVQSYIRAKDEEQK